MGSKSSSSVYRNDLLAGKLALVTGAGKGIGRECVLALAGCGAKVIAVARTSKDLESLQNDGGSNILPHCADASTDVFLDFIATQPIDILINNLGTNTPQDFVDVTDEALDRMLDLNVRTVFRITRQVVNRMKNDKRLGSIVNISSQMGHVGSPRRTVYCTTKHAVEGFTKALGVELGPLGIRVNSVCPTFIETEMTKPMFEDPSFKQFVLDKIPLGHIGTPTDVANAVVYLASEASVLVTASSLMVDGGWTAH